MAWEPTAEQKRNYEERGYFTVENVVPRQTAAEMLGVIKNAILTPDDGRHHDRCRPDGPDE